LSFAVVAAQGRKALLTDSLVVIRETPGILQRRGVGKVHWRNMINELIASEQEDMLDLNVLRRKVKDPELQSIISQLYERKSIRIIELNNLLRYRDDSGKRDDQ
jgi:hypothetical protein